jgi:hypothetical protein
MILPKEYSSSLLINPKEKKTDELPSREFKRMILRKLNEIQENTDDSMKLVRQFKI